LTLFSWSLLLTVCRLGSPELAEMFPRKNYVTVSDMAGLGMHKVQELYESWKSRAEKGGGNKDKNNAGSVKVKKKQPPPTQLFETLLSIVNPPLYSTLPKHREKIKTIMALPEYEAPAHAMEGFKKTFQRKFGKNLNARAEHMAKDLLQMVWGDFNNYKTVGAVLTKHHIVKAISTEHAPPPWSTRRSGTGSASRRPPSSFSSQWTACWC
jgi:hypothetical protein